MQRIQRINRAVEEIRRAREEAQDSAHEAPAPAAAPDAQDVQVEHAITLSLEEAASGCIRSVEGLVARPCSECGGSGEAPEPQPCPQCNGRGQSRPSLWFPWLAATSACGACEGSGTAPASCSRCGGSGQSAPLAYRTRLRIPPGVRDGHRLHARVKLRDGAGHVALEVRVTLAPHAFLSLQEDGIVRIEMPVDGFAWVAGRWVEVPTLQGLRRMRLQRGALTYRIKAAGFPVTPSGARADCLVSVVPLFPSEWGERQDALIDALIEGNTQDETTEAGARVRDWNEQVAAWAQREATTADN